MASLPSVVNFDGIRIAERAQGLANILAVGTATPLNCFYQTDYPDYYFRITNSEHLVDLKEKFKRICDKTTIKKRYMHHTEEFLKENPNMCGYNTPSLNARQDLLFHGVPNVGMEAATKAIDEWGLQTSNITHLIFCTTSNLHVPGPDYHLTKLLGLSASVKRLMMYQQGCSGGGMALRVAKDIAENNKGSRVLLVCCEMIASLFRGPNENHIGSLVGQALFGDGAAAIIVGADPNSNNERSLFEIVSASHTILPQTENAMILQLGEAGLTVELARNVPEMISKDIELVLMDALSDFTSIRDCNSLFWIVHPGGRAILDEVELNLKLKKEKLWASRHVLSEYGNLGSPSVLFVMDEIRMKSKKEGKRNSTTGEGLDLGVLLAFGPGLTVETVVLRCSPASASFVRD